MSTLPPGGWLQWLCIGRVLFPPSRTDRSGSWRTIRISDTPYYDVAVAFDTVDGTIVVEVDEIEGGHLKWVTCTFDGTGPYTIACHEPGQHEAGMKGTITLHS